MEDKAQIPDTPAKFDRYVERAVFQFHPVRGHLRSAAVSEAVRSMPEGPPLGQVFVRALPAKWRSVVAALARAIHGGYQGFTLPLRFNGRPCSQRIPYVRDTRWTTVVEDVWKKREMQGHGEAILPHLVEFQENPNPKDSGLIIQFCDYEGRLVHTYKDPSSEFKYRILIKDAPKKTTVWTVIGVDEDNWWNDYAPGMDCMREFAPGPYYDPSVQINVLCTGKQVDDAMCSYLYDVMTSRQQTSDSVIFHWCRGAWGELVAGSSSCGKLRKDRTSDRLPLGGARPKNCAQSISREVHQTKQYKMLLEDKKVDECQD